MTFFYNHLNSQYFTNQVLFIRRIPIATTQHTPQKQYYYNFPKPQTHQPPQQYFDNLNSTYYYKTNKKLDEDVKHPANTSIEHEEQDSQDSDETSNETIHLIDLSSIKEKNQGQSAPSKVYNEEFQPKQSILGQQAPLLTQYEQLFEQKAFKIHDHMKSSFYNSRTHKTQTHHNHHHQQKKQYHHNYRQYYDNLHPTTLAEIDQIVDSVRATTYRPPVIKRQIIEVNSPPGRVKKVIRRLETPMPSVFERVTLIQQPRTHVNLIIEKPHTPPPIIKSVFASKW